MNNFRNTTFPLTMLDIINLNHEKSKERIYIKEKGKILMESLRF